MIFSYNFFKSDKFLLRSFTRFFLKKLGYINRQSNFPQFIILNHDYVSSDILIDGYYEIKELTTLCEWLKTKKKISCVIDVGAYLGNHSVFFSNYFKTVYSFEPNTFSFKLLKLNTINQQNIKIYNFGLSDKNQIKNFYSYESNYGGSSVKKNKKIKFTKIKAKFLKFDDLKIKKKADLIKIDVEGHELNVLKGMSNYISKHKPLIAFETQKSEIKNGTSKVLDYLKKKNYKKFYSIENYKSQNFIFNIINILNFIFFNRKKYIVKKEKFEKKFYSFIIAEY
tara:strand:- start:462 stop:1307 length:846 start_codon:yes stop_codon:yes gene_type:complete